MPTALQTRTLLTAKKARATYEQELATYEQELGKYETEKKAEEKRYWDELEKRFFERVKGFYSEYDQDVPKSRAHEAIQILKEGGSDRYKKLAFRGAQYGGKQFAFMAQIAKAYGPFTYPDFQLSKPQTPEQIKKAETEKKLMAIKMRGRGSRGRTILTDMLGLSQEAPLRMKTLLGQ